MGRNTKIKKNRKNEHDSEGKVNALELYTVMLANKISPGYTFQSHELKDDELGINYDSVETRGTVKKFFYVKAFSKQIPLAYLSQLRDAVQKGSLYKVKMHYQTQLSPHTIDFNSRIMQDRRRRWLNAIEVSDNKKRAQNSALQTKADGADNARQEWLIDSWRYWILMDNTHRQLFHTRITIELEIDRSVEGYAEYLYNASKNLVSKAAKENLAIKPVANFMLDFLASQSIVSLRSTRYASKKMSSRVLSDIIISKLFRIAQGELNPKNGIPVGFDMLSQNMVYKCFAKETQDAENCLITGETGAGKSFFMKFFLLNLLCYGLDAIILDYEGFEYTALLEEIGGIRIAIGTKDGGYPDTLEIAECIGDEKTDQASFERSITATIAIFDALCSTDTGMDAREISIFNDAFNRIRITHNVVREDKTTWSNSKNLSYRILYQEIKAMGQEPAVLSEYGETVNLFIIKLKPFFEPDGIYSSMFSKKLSVNDILPKKSKLGNLIIFSYDMQGKTDSGNMMREITLKQITCSYLTSTICMHNRKNEKFTFIGLEEFQRYCKNKGAYRVASELFTGARKLNAICGIITNSPAALVSESNEYAQDIGNNIQNYFIGKLKENNIDSVCDAWGLGRCKEILRKMNSEPDNYQHMFLGVLDSKDCVLLKAKVPKALQDSKIFATRSKEMVV